MNSRRNHCTLLALLVMTGAVWTCLAGDVPLITKTTSDKELRQLVAADVTVLTKSRLSADDNMETFLRSLAATRFAFWQQAANKGFPEGQTLYGLCFDYGIVVTNDTTSAMKWYRMAAEQGYAPAQYQMGECFHSPEYVGRRNDDDSADFNPFSEKGIRLKTDRTRAERIICAGISTDPPPRDLADEIFGRGNSYANAVKVEAAKWYRRAADQGYVPAQAALGQCYSFGNGIPKDQAEAAKWDLKAADGGHARAHFIVGNNYVLGTGVIQDDVLACCHYLISGALGVSKAADYAENLHTKKLSRAEYAEAQRMANEWMEKFKSGSGDGETKESGQSKSGNAPQLLGSGSGFVLSDDGYFLTCAHVVKGCGKVSVRIGGTSYSATVVKVDKVNDVALLKLEGKGFQSVPLRHELPEMGAKVFTVGFPNPDIQGSAPKYADGAISAVTGMQDDIRTMQVTVPVQPGNSGGPLVDEAGNAVGIVVSKLNAAMVFEYTGDIPQNVNFAVKIGYAMPLIQSVPGLSKRLPSIREARKGLNMATELEKGTGMVFVYK